MAKEKILFVGNCQKNLIAKIAEFLAYEADIQIIHSAHIIHFGAEKYRSLLDDADVVFSQPLIGEKFGFFQEKELTSLNKRIVYFPSLVFNGYHPDCVYLGSGKYLSPIGGYHSSIAALAYALHYDAKKAELLYCDDVYEELGYYALFESEIVRISASLNRFGIVLDQDIGDLMRSGRLMHSINHPTAELLSLFTAALLKKSDVPARDTDATPYVVDLFPDSTIFPVFPEIGAKFGFDGSYVFKADQKAAAAGQPFYDLPEFLDATFRLFDNMKEKEEVLSNPRFTPDYVEKAHTIFEHTLTKQSKIPQKSFRKHPYAGLPDHQNWKKSFKDIPLHEIDLAIDSAPFIKGTDKIATAGSCFAQHIAKSLSSSGYNYFIAEKPSTSMSKTEAINNGFGIFSARYGNIYTARQLLQLFDRAFSTFNPNLPEWDKDNNKVVDPFRPQVTPEGFANTDAMLADRKSHLSAVKRMFEELDIFVFTLGLTEAWRHKVDGAILPIAPGVTAGIMDTNEYEPVNFSFSEVYTDMVEFLDKLKAVNSTAQVLLTVSPVPLMATFEPRHVLVSTTVSKSILRAVADQLVREYSFVRYFPSYEIITGNYTRGQYFEDDLREVKPEGVNHVMQTFLSHCVYPVENVAQISGELDELDQIVCDEEALNV